MYYSISHIRTCFFLFFGRKSKVLGVCGVWKSFGYSEVNDVTNRRGTGADLTT